MIQSENKNLYGTMILGQKMQLYEVTGAPGQETFDSQKLNTSHATQMMFRDILYVSAVI